MMIEIHTLGADIVKALTPLVQNIWEAGVD